MESQLAQWVTIGVAVIINGCVVAYMFGRMSSKVEHLQSLIWGRIELKEVLDELLEIRDAKLLTMLYEKGILKAKEDKNGK